MMIEIIGKPAMLEQLAEEATELAHAALKMARYLRGENPTPKTQEEVESNLVEEFTDLIQCSRELKLYPDEEQIKTKEQRFKDRMAQQHKYDREYWDKAYPIGNTNSCCKGCHQEDPSNIQCFNGHIQGKETCEYYITTEDYLKRMG